MRTYAQHACSFLCFFMLSGLLAPCAKADNTFGDGKRPAPGFSRPPYHFKKHSTSSPTGYTPVQILHAYGFDRIANQGQGQVIAIIDAYDDPAIESDLGVFDTAFGLPPCTSHNHCFQKIYAAGVQPKANPRMGDGNRPGCGMVACHCAASQNPVSRSSFEQ